MIEAIHFGLANSSLSEKNWSTRVSTRSDFEYAQPLSSRPRLSTQALHWDRGRPARSEHRKVRKSQESSRLRTFCSRCALTAGGPPAVPVKNLSRQAHRRTIFQTEPPPKLLINSLRFQCWSRRLATLFFVLSAAVVAGRWTSTVSKRN